MKKAITLSLALLTFASIAQYNNTYDVNTNSDNLTPSFVITNKLAESITVSYASDAPSTPRRDYFILTKHDAYGSVLYNNRIDPFNAPTDGLTHVEALIETDDHGVLVAGYHYDDANYVEQPFLLKVDVSGNVQWVKLYYLNQKPIFNSQLNKISLCRVYDDPQENYFIVGSADSDYKPGQDVAISVIKVDNTGKLIFANKYYNTLPTQFSLVRDYPGDIDYSTVDKMYMMTGFRQDVANNTGSRVMFYLGINSAGNVVTKFLTLASKSTPIDQDVVYDPNKNVFATVFTHERSSYVAGINSQIGFITVDAVLNIANPKYLWHKYGSDHNGRSISLSTTGEYILGSGTYDNNSIFLHNPALQKVDAGGNPTSAYYRYNVNDEVIFGHHANSYNPSTFDEEYVMVNRHKDDLRVIRTDVIGHACGSVKYEAYVDKYTPKQAFYTYKPKQSGFEKVYKVYEKQFFPDYRKCENNASSYRTTGIAKITVDENTMILYPSVMTLSNANLTVENNSATTVKMEVRTITGQLILVDNELATGKTQVSLNQGGNLSVGMYLVKIYSADGTLNHASKILITQ